MGNNKKQSNYQKIKKNIKRKESISLQSQVIEKAMWLSRVKNQFAVVETTKKIIEARLEKNRLKRYLPKLKADILIKDNYLKEVYYIGDFAHKEKVIIYLHGGAYINQPMRQHWKFVDNIFNKTNVSVIFPLYPKAPEYNYKDCFDYLFKLYKDVMKEDYKEIIIMGDSAGGGLALAFSQYLKQKKQMLPSKIILLSPWLDVSMSNSKIDKYENVDPMLSKAGLLEVGKIWSNGESLTNYLVSPIYGDFTDLDNITVFVGTHEILLPDNRLLKEKHKHIHYHEYKHMNHVFPLYPIPEAKDAINKIIKIINPI